MYGLQDQISLTLFCLIRNLLQMHFSFSHFTKDFVKLPLCQAQFGEAQLYWRHLESSIPIYRQFILFYIFLNQQYFHILCCFANERSTITEDRTNRNRPWFYCIDILTQKNYKNLKIICLGTLVVITYYIVHFIMYLNLLCAL